MTRHATPTIDADRTESTTRQTGVTLPSARTVLCALLVAFVLGAGVMALATGGAAPALADEHDTNGNETDLENATAEDIIETDNVTSDERSLLLSDAVLLEDVQVRSPHYVSTEPAPIDDGIRAHGAEQDLIIGDFEEADVTRSGVLEGDTRLEYDSRIGAWTISVAEDGTYTLWWEVRREVGDSRVIGDDRESVLWLTQQDPATLDTEQRDSVETWTDSEDSRLSDPEQQQLDDWRTWRDEGEEPGWADDGAVPPAGTVDRPDGERDTETQMYALELQLRSVDLVHEDADAFAETEDKADNWDDEVVTPLSSYMAEDQISRYLSIGIAWAIFVAAPYAGFQESFFIVATSLVFTPGGLFWVAVLLLPPLLWGAREAVKRHRAEDRLADVDDVEREKAFIEAEKSKQFLAQMDLADTDGPALTERIALPIRQAAGDNVWSAVQHCTTALSTPSLKQLKLGACQDSDREFRVRRDDEETRLVDIGEESGPAVADGGVDATPGDGPESEAGADGTVETWRIREAPPAVLEALSLEAIPSEPLRRGHLDASASDLPSVPGAEFETVEEMVTTQMTEMGIDPSRDIGEDLEAWAESIADLMSYVAASAYTDDSGAARPEMRALNILYTLVESASEQGQVAYFREYELAMQAAADHLRPEQRTRKYVDDLRSRGPEALRWEGNDRPGRPEQGDRNGAGSQEYRRGDGDDVDGGADTSDGDGS